MIAEAHVIRKGAAAIALAAAAILSACAPGPPVGGGGAVTRGEAVPVALLVPGGSGEQGDTLLAENLENGARLAAGDLSDASVDLRVYETAGVADRAAAMAERAVDDGARVILGPVFAEGAEAAAEAVAPRGVTVLSFSNDPTIAGGNLFILGPTFRNTADQLAAFMVRQGKARIMLVRDPNRAGRLGADAIRDAAAGRPVDVVAEADYEFSQEGVVDAAPRIAERAEEAGADALFLTADSAGALPLLVQLLPENGLPPEDIQYVGLTRWDIPASTLELSGVQGGWFALPDPSLTERFETRYAEAHGGAPHPIASLAYDGVAAIGALAAAGKGPSREALTQPSGFAGVGGVFRLLTGGTNERALAIAEIRDGEATVIAPAPRSFSGGTGF